MSMRYQTSAVKRQNRDGWIMQDSERYHLEERDKYKELFYSFVRAMSKAIDERTPLQRNPYQAYGLERGTVP